MPASRLLTWAALATAALLIGAHILAVHEGDGWTSPLLIGDHLFDLLVAIAVVWYALALGRRVGRPLLGLSDEPLTEGLAALGLGLGALSLLLFAAGALHLYYGPLFVGAGIVGTIWLRAELARVLRQALAGSMGWLRRGVPTAPTRGQRLVLVIVLIQLAVLLPWATLPISNNASTTDFDALAYHLAGPKIFLAAHGFVPRPDIPLANAPLGGEMLFIPGLLVDAQSMPRMFDLLLTAILCAAVYALGRRHFGQAGAWLGVLLFAATPWLAPMTTMALPDLAAALLLVLGVSDLLGWAATGRPAPRRHGDTKGVRRKREAEGGHAEERLLVRAGLLVGLAISYKLTNIPALPAAGVTVGVLSLLTMGAAIRERVAAALRNGMLVGAAMVAPLAPWLLKSLYQFGNPFYPAGLSVNDSGTHPMATLAGVGTHPSPAYHAWWIVATLGTTYWRYISPLSPLLLLTPLAARTRAARSVTLLLAIMGICWILFVPLYLPPRYWLGLSAVSDAAIAATLGALAARLLAGRAYLALCLAAVLDMGLWLGTTAIDQPAPFWLGMVATVGLLIIGILAGPLRQRARAAWLELPIVAGLSITLLLGIFVMAREMEGGAQVSVAVGTLSRRDYLMQNNWYFPAFAWVGRHTPRDTTVVLVNLSTGYYLDRPYLDDWYGARLATLRRGGAAARAEVASWCRAGVDVAIFDHGMAPLGAYAWTQAPALHAHTLFDANGVDVLAVRPCATR